MTGAAAFLVLCAIAAIVIEATYFFPSDPLLYARSMRLVNQDHDASYYYYLAGHVSPRFIAYFAATYFLKEPIATLALVLTGLVVVLRDTKLTRLDKLFLLLPPAAVWAAHTLLADNLGIRYIIPALPFGYLIGGIGLARMVESGAAWKRAAAAVLCVWLVVAAIGIYPDDLSYFNESACVLAPPGDVGLDGGSRCGTYWLEDSNVDWGEGLKQLKTWMDRHAAGRKFRFAYMGTYPPRNYGLNYDEIPTDGLLPEPSPGLYAVSAHLLVRAFMNGVVDHNEAGAWLRRIRPIAIVGHCLYIYDIPAK